MNGRRTGRLATVAAAVLLGCVLAMVLGGCREQVELSEVDQFLSRFGDLDRDAYVDTLRSMRSATAPTNLYANYELGNVFYALASDTAKTIGWKSALALSLLDSSQLYFENAAGIDSAFVPALVNLGSLWSDRAGLVGQTRAARTEKQQKLSQAEMLYLQALRHAPGDETARCNLGSLYLDQKKPTEAVAQFQKVLETNPESALAHYNLAIMFAEEEIYDEAITEFKAAAKYGDDDDIGERARANLEIIDDLLNAPIPENVKTGGGH